MDRWICGWMDWQMDGLEDERIDVLILSYH